MAKQIYEDDRLYDFCRCITDFYIHHSFRKLKYDGLDKIPTDGPIIFAPNHCNALLDPLAVLALDKSRKVFVARADIFAKPAIHKILTFLKIMPINRRRDGIRNMTKAEETIEKSIEVLNNHVNFCILCEGTHRAMHSLLPIGKGIARVACGAHAKLGPDTPLYIVPMGLDYADYFRFRNTLLVKIGDPINVASYIEEYPDRSEHDIMEDIRNMVGDGIREQLVYIPDDDEYEPTWELSRIASGHISPMNLDGRFDANREAIAKIERLRATDEGRAAGLFAKARAFAKDRKAAGLSLNSLRLASPAVRALLCTLLALVTLPLAVFAAVTTLPIWLANEIVVSKIKDDAFHNSFRCGIITIIWPLLLVIWAVVLFCTVKWYWALATLALLILAPMAVYDYAELLRMTLSHWKCTFSSGLRRRYIELKKELNNI